MRVILTALTLAILAAASMYAGIWLVADQLVSEPGPSAPAVSSPQAPGGTEGLAGDATVSQLAEQILRESIVRVEARLESAGPSPRTRTARVSQGTGTILKVVRNGYIILTAAHVLEEGDLTAKRLAGRLTCDGTRIARLDEADLALFECIFSEAGGLPNLPDVNIVHDPSGYQGKPVLFRCHFDEGYRQGTVTGFATSSSGVRLIVTDAPAEPGCSGTALLDLQGNLIGVVIGAGIDSGSATAAIVPETVSPAALQGN
ncbi:MAG TPA: serine protease [Dehalococcoidia bacterium]|nr:serine protease [Dehalococcoidia bacterium]